MFLDVDSDSQIVLIKPGYVATNFTARSVGVLILFEYRTCMCMRTLKIYSTFHCHHVKFIYLGNRIVFPILMHVPFSRSSFSLLI